MFGTILPGLNCGKDKSLSPKYEISEPAKTIFILSTSRFPEFFIFNDQSYYNLGKNKGSLTTESVHYLLKKVREKKIFDIKGKKLGHSRYQNNLILFNLAIDFFRFLHAISPELKIPLSENASCLLWIKKYTSRKT